MPANCLPHEIRSYESYHIYFIDLEIFSEGNQPRQENPLVFIAKEPIFDLTALASSLVDSAGLPAVAGLSDGAWNNAAERVDLPLGIAFNRFLMI